MHSAGNLKHSARRALICSIAALILLFQAGPPLLGQSNRPEIFALAGVGRVSGDDGYLGQGVVAGGAVTLPFSKRWAFDFDLTHVGSERNVASGLRVVGRHTHISPALQYRRGHEDLYGFVAFGAGATVATEPNEFRGGGYSRTHTSLQWHAKVGVVKTLSRRLLLRAQFGTNFQPVSFDLGTSVGLGWRF